MGVWLGERDGCPSMEWVLVGEGGVSTHGVGVWFGEREGAREKEHGERCYWIMVINYAEDNIYQNFKFIITCILFLS